MLDQDIYSMHYRSEDSDTDSGSSMASLEYRADYDPEVIRAYYHRKYAPDYDYDGSEVSDVDGVSLLDDGELPPNLPEPLVPHQKTRRADYPLVLGPRDAMKTHVNMIKEWFYAQWKFRKHERWDEMYVSPTTSPATIVLLDITDTVQYYRKATGTCPPHMTQKLMELERQLDIVHRLADEVRQVDEALMPYFREREAELAVAEITALKMENEALRKERNKVIGECDRLMLKCNRHRDQRDRNFRERNEVVEERDALMRTMAKIRDALDAV